MSQPPIPGDCCPRYFDLDVTLHRLDNELELAVCNKCGEGRVQDLSSWTRLQDSMKQFDKSMDRMTESLRVLSEKLSELAELSSR